MVEGAVETGDSPTSVASGVVHVVSFGAPAIDELGRAIADVKRDDPLTPVTVVVPSALAAVTVRRRLARAHGVIAVDTVSMPGLASRLASRRVAADRRRPLGRLEAAAVARTVLSHDNDRLAAAADHPGTVESLLRTFDELRPLDAATLARLAASSSRASEVVELYRSYRRTAKQWIDDHDVVEMAVDAVRNGDPAVHEVGAVILHLPRRLSASDLALVAALHERGGLHAVLVGITGRARADMPQHEMIDQLVGSGSSRDDPLSSPHSAMPKIIRAADPAEEVRAAVRSVLEGIAEGVVPDRIAVVSRVASPYTLLVHEELSAAGIPHSAPATMQLGQSIAGRVLLGLLQWKAKGLRRDDLMRLLRSAPLRDPDGRRTRPDRWDRVARDAGVVAGIEQWRQRLDAARSRLIERSAPFDPDEHAQRRLAELDGLRTFVDRLADDTDPGDRRTWSALSRWASRLLGNYLERDAVTARRSDAEQRSRVAVFDLLDALASLDEFGDAPGFDNFCRVVEHELSRAAGRAGRFGHGVFVGRLADTVGSDLDDVIVVGCAEGVFPPRATDDPLLPEHDRRAGGAALRPRGSTPAEEERDALAAIASARRCTLTFPIADPRDQHARQPAPFVLEQCSRLLGERVDTDGVGRLRDNEQASSWFLDLPSFEWWLAEGGAPATSTEFDVRELLRARSTNQTLEQVPVVQSAGLARGLTAARARIAGELGEWSGSVGSWPQLTDDLGTLRSATSLQRWATCPFRYFLGHVLEVNGLEDPGEFETITAADRGTLVHEVLERYFRARIDGSPVTIEEIADEAEARFRASGHTGRPLLWEAEWAALRRHLMRVLAMGADDPVLSGVAPVAVEHRFGFSGRERSPDGAAVDIDDGDVAVDPVSVALGDQSEVRFRGSVDRIDRSSDGTRLVVLDYKTGSATPYKVLDAGHQAHDVVARGTLLQLPVYAMAARAAFPDATSVEAYYWFIGQRGEIGMLGGLMDDATEDRFRAVVGTIADGIEGGLFPARPGEEMWLPGVGITHQNCRYCEFDKLCPTGRGEQWVTLRDRDELRPYVELAEGPLPDGDDKP
jgi:hypothetical protein